MIEYQYCFALPRGIEWERVPHAMPGVNRANYRLVIDGNDTGIQVRWCGHPTALRPYYVVTKIGEILAEKFRTVEQAKRAALATLTKETDDDNQRPY